METLAIVALVAATAVDFVGLSMVLRRDFHACSDPVAVAADTPQADLNPVVLARRIVPQKSRFLPGVEYNDVDVSIVIQVIEDRATAAMLGEKSVATAVGNVHEFPGAGVHQYNVPRTVARGPIEVIDVIDQMPASDEDIAVTVVIEIGKAGSPCDLRVGARAAPTRRVTSSNSPSPLF